MLKPLFVLQETLRHVFGIRSYDTQIPIRCSPLDDQGENTAHMPFQQHFGAELHHGSLEDGAVAQDATKDQQGLRKVVFQSLVLGLRNIPYTLHPSPQD